MHVWVTVRVAGVEFVEPAWFVNTARYSFSLRAVAVGLIFSVAAVAPAMSANVVPPSDDTCHWIVAAAHSPPGIGLSDTVNDAGEGAGTVTSAGCVATVGGVVQIPLAVNVAGVDAVEPPALTRTARYSLPLSDVEVGAIVRVFVLAPAMSLYVSPPSVDTCHWNAAGVQPAATAPSATVNVTAAGGCVVWSVGCVAITGGVAHP